LLINVDFENGFLFYRNNDYEKYCNMVL